MCHAQETTSIIQMDENPFLFNLYWLQVMCENIEALHEMRATRDMERFLFDGIAFVVSRASADLCGAKLLPVPCPTIMLFL